MCLLQRIGKQGLLQKRLTTYGQRSSSDSGRNIDEDKLAETRSDKLINTKLYHPT